MRAFYLFFTVVALALALAGCGSFLPVDGVPSEEDDAGSAITHVDDGGADGFFGPDVLGSLGACRDSKMLRVDSAEQTFCIDSTEVTNDAYEVFITSGPTVGGGFSLCSWKTSHTTPYSSGPADQSIVGVDWCDAAVFCSSNGKRLCREQEWLDACSANHPGVFDLTGGVYEWLDAPCTRDVSPDLDTCVLRGVSTCGSATTTRRSTRLSALGFRCCADD